MAMQTAAEAAERARRSVLSGSTASTTSARTDETSERGRLPARMMRRLWERMASIYPEKWRSVMGETPMSADKPDELSIYGDTWARGLAMFSGDQIAKGLEKALETGREWPPALPVFQFWCSGVQSFDEVRAEFAPGFRCERSQFGRLVYLNLDTWAWRHAPEDRADRMLRDAYREAVRWIRDGKPLPPSPVADLGHEQCQRKGSTPEVAEAALQDIAAILGMGTGR